MKISQISSGNINRVKADSVYFTMANRLALRIYRRAITLPCRQAAMAYIISLNKNQYKRCDPEAMPGINPKS